MNDNFPNLSPFVAEIVAAYVAHHTTDINDMPLLIRRVHEGLASINTPTSSHPRFAVEESITPDYLICLEDGKKTKLLKNYLKKVHNLTPEEYRTRWGLPQDYPMVAPNYAKMRSKLARTNKLGTKRENVR